MPTLYSSPAGQRGQRPRLCPAHRDEGITARRQRLDRRAGTSLTNLLAAAPLWATVPFQLILEGQVTTIDIGLCREGTQQPVIYDNHLYMPMVIT